MENSDTLTAVREEAFAETTKDRERESGPPKQMDADETRYMQGDVEPVTSSVLISNSKYLNNPYYRDAFAQQALRRCGHDLPPTYVIPMVHRAIGETTDVKRFAELVAVEKQTNVEFAQWVDARRLYDFRAENLHGYAAGTLGETLRAFVEESGMNLDILKPRPINGDLDYITQRRVPSHDIEHMVTGFGPNPIGEGALAVCNVTSIASYFSAELAQVMSHSMMFVGSASFMRNSLHYPAVMPAYMDGLRQGIAAGQALKKPLFMIDWEDYFDWKIEDLAVHLGIQRGPESDWDWSVEGASG